MLFCALRYGLHDSGRSFSLANLLLVLALLLTSCGADATPAPASPSPPDQATDCVIGLTLWDEEVAEGWTIENSWGLQLGTARQAFRGRVALSLRIQDSYNGLFLSVAPDIDRPVYRPMYLAARFWINPGEAPLSPQDVRVALVGHDSQIFWARDTHSAPQDDLAYAPEVALTAVGVGQDLPANTWTPVTVWWPLLPTPPSFAHITGLYVKFAAQAQRALLVDQIELLAIRDDQPPSVWLVENAGLSNIVARFAEAVNASDAVDPTNYALSSEQDAAYAQPTWPSAVSYDPTLREATLTLSRRLLADTAYNLSVEGIRDHAATPNVMPQRTYPLLAKGFVVQVDVAADHHPISPHIYGMSSVPEDYQREINIPLSSWGGNANTRYNWKLGNAWNAARDWYYVNGDYGYQGQSASDDFVRQNQLANAASLLTIPTIGWVAKDTQSCSFRLPDGTCGDASGAYCERPGQIADPEATSVRADPAYMVEWVEHLAANDLQVEYLAMDNEPDIWGTTHYDIHPTCTTYSEIYQRFVDYATPIKRAAPDSLICGPVSCCWWYYWNSQAGAADKASHGDQDLLPWFMDQVRAHDKALGVRTLDVLDIHYYPASFFNDDVSAETAAGRLRSTRSLWDPTYVDESWIGEPVYLVPRMKALIDEHYPGTLFGISEWNWGADTTMNGALAIADVLGIYGREGVQLAAYWSYPEQYSPGYYAFAMYTAFDGENRFGDQSVRAVSDDQDQVSVYAALDSNGGDLHIMLINKDSNREANIQFKVDGYAAKTQARLYRYSQADLNAIASEPLQVSADMALTLPAYSISLLVLSPGATSRDYHLPLILHM